MSLGSFPPWLSSPFWAMCSEWKTVTIGAERTTSSGLWGVRNFRGRASLWNNLEEACYLNGGPSHRGLGCRPLPRKAVRIRGDDEWKRADRRCGIYGCRLSPCHAITLHPLRRCFKLPEPPSPWVHEVGPRTTTTLHESNNWKPVTTRQGASSHRTRT